jgi:hypothetical protein
VLAVAVVAFTAAAGAIAGGGHGHGDVTVIATGLEGPRGLTVGPDGNVYVAEAGTAGDLTTAGPPPLCTQVPVPIGLETGDFTSRISRIDRHGNRTTVADNLPSSKSSDASGGLVSGVADVKFLEGRLYTLMAGAGCSHGLRGTVNSLLRVNGNGTTMQVADLSAFQQYNPVANPEPDDFEPYGTWYSMVASSGALYAVEPNHGEVDRITPWGSVSRVVDVSASYGHVVPTSLSENGNFYFGNLGLFPIVPSSSNIWKLTPSGNLKVVATGLTTVLGTAWNDGKLYALESMTAPEFPSPAEVGTGMVVRVERDGTLTPVVTGLSFPSAMTFGPDGDLFISNFGFAVPTGEIVRVDESCLDRRGGKPACSY